MAHKLISLVLDPYQHPGCTELKMTAVVGLGPECNAVNNAAKQITLNIRAEPQRYAWRSRAKFTCRLDSCGAANYEAKRKYSIGGLNAVEGLNEAARKLATDTWATPVVPDTPIDQNDAYRALFGINEGTVVAVVKNSESMQLVLEKLNILGVEYSGELTYNVGSPCLSPYSPGGVYPSGRNSLNTESKNPNVRKDNYNRLIGMNDAIVSAIAAWLIPLAQSRWDYLAPVAHAKHIEELERAVKWEMEQVTRYTISLEESKKNLAGFEADLAKVRKQK